MKSNARRILGTAGHIDHGKTALIRAISGQETDRLREEKERGISIELGFAHHEIGELQFGIVDVPGHERFLRHMLAGAQGIDLVLLVVAADDGIMPQTEEHFDILHLLGVAEVLFVITKTDLVNSDRVSDVREEIEILTAGTRFEKAITHAVSSTTGFGIAALQEEIREILLSLTPREIRGPFRLPIDRSFLLHGQGLVVTGTANSGSIQQGDALTILPSGVETRARSVQVHGERLKEAGAGQRIALNLAGVEKGDAPRGAWVTDPTVWSVTNRLDCELEVRPGAGRGLRSFERIRFHIGTSEVHGKIIFLGETSEVAPKEKAFCQIALDDEILAAHGDRFVIRNEAAQRTVGGGIVLHPTTDRHRAGEANVPTLLEELRDHEGAALIRPFLELLPTFGATLSLIQQGLLLQSQEIHQALPTTKDLVALPSIHDPETITTAKKWSALTEQVNDALANYHRSHPMESGMDLESLRSRLRISVPQKLFRAVIELLEKSNTVIRDESIIRLPKHTLQVPRDEAQILDRLSAAIRKGGFTPPDAKQLSSMLDLSTERIRKLLKVLLDQGRVQRVSGDIHYDLDSLSEITGLLQAHLTQHSEITVGEFRNQISASRKYALALMDYFDQTGVTIRIGDARRLRESH